MAGPVGELHPVQGLLEKFEAGPGCAARERGNKETHVIAVGRVSNSPENKVTSSKFPKRSTPQTFKGQSEKCLKVFITAETLAALSTLLSGRSLFGKSQVEMVLNVKHSVEPQN